MSTPRAAHTCLLFLSLTACKGEKEESGGPVCSPPALDAGTVSASVDGAAWTATEATWTPSGTAIQLNTVLAEGWRLTLVMNNAVPDLEAGETPIIREMTADGSEAWALLYPEAGGSYSSKDGIGGSAVVSSVDGDEIVGCFAFEGVGSGGTVAVEDGYFRALPL